MNDPNLIRLCRLPADLGAAAGRELYLDQTDLAFLVGPLPGVNGSAGSAEPLTDFLSAHPDLRESVHAFVVGRMTGQPQAYAEEKDDRLRSLLAGITDENRHEETDWGPPVGREAW